MYYYYWCTMVNPKKYIISKCMFNHNIGKGIKKTMYILYLSSSEKPIKIILSSKILPSRSHYGITLQDGMLLIKCAAKLANWNFKCKQRWFVMPIYNEKEFVLYRWHSFLLDIISSKFVCLHGCIRSQPHISYHTTIDIWCSHLSSLFATYKI